MWRVLGSFNPHVDKVKTIFDTISGNEIWFDYDDVDHQEIDALSAEVVDILNEPGNVIRIERAIRAVQKNSEE